MVSIPPEVLNFLLALWEGDNDPQGGFRVTFRRGGFIETVLALVLRLFSLTLAKIGQESMAMNLPSMTFNAMS